MKRKLTGFSLLFIGLLSLGYVAYDYFGFQLQSQRELEKVEQLFEDSPYDATRIVSPVKPSGQTELEEVNNAATGNDAPADIEETKETVGHSPSAQAAIDRRTPPQVKPTVTFPPPPDEYSPESGDLLGSLEIPSISLSFPIVEGVDRASLKRGIGHDPSTWLPGEGNQIFLAGHNDSAFLKMGQIEIGDTVFFHTSYGIYEYTITADQIVSKDDTWIVGDMEQETLVLMTCYPFYSWQDPPERYLLFATPSSTP